VADTPDLGDIQGIITFAYGDLRAACFVMLAVKDAAAARAWLGALAPSLTTAGGSPAPVAINVAITIGGLGRLGLPASAANAFAPEFVDGLVTANRSRQLGDTGSSAPANWAWGGPGSDPVDLVLMLYSRDPAGLDALYRSQAAGFTAGGVAQLAKLDTSDLGVVEPFGFRDGVSQPVVDGFPGSLPLGPPGPGSTPVRMGEFILGYTNEYGLYTDRPLLDPSADPSGVLARDPAGSGRADLGRNGSYLVFRQLEQDVAGFWQFVDGVSRDPDGQPDPAARGHLAAKIVGRWPSGAPLVQAPDRDDPSLATSNDFGYFREDRDGLRCPVGAHIRRTNPRDSLDPKPGSQASIGIGNRHRIIRRGREYGTLLSPEEAIAGGSTSDSSHGLYFACVNANISRQFEFIQRTWVNNPKFNGLYNDRDPLVAPQPGGSFSVPGLPVRTRVNDLPSFVTVVGGAYFFLPGIKAARYLATLYS
jgi:Dyp-type peroxidase family